MNALWLILLFFILLAVMAFFVLLLRQVSLLKREIQHQSLDQSVQLDEHFKKENQNLSQLAHHFSLLSREVDHSSRNLEKVQDQMESIHSVMSHPKRRGNFGELQMETLITNYLGDSRKLFERQYLLENGKVADGVLKIADQDKVLCIDSKFPMENYVRFEKSGSEKDRKEFIRNMKGHIDAISEKYITEQTLPVALLFLPGEGIFSRICSDEGDLLEYAYSRNVLICSPTTLTGILSMLLSSTQSFYQSRNFSRISRQLDRIEKELDEMIDPLQKVLSRQRQQTLDLERSLTALENFRQEVRSLLNEKNDQF